MWARTKVSTLLQPLRALPSRGSLGRAGFQQTRQKAEAAASATKTAASVLQKGMKQKEKERLQTIVDVPSLEKAPPSSPISPSEPAAASSAAATPQPEEFKMPNSSYPLPRHQEHYHIEIFAPKIVVVGVGGAGGNAVNNMIARGLEGVKFVVCNTDSQHLNATLADNRVQMGRGQTGGLGAGAKPQIGREAALESQEEILDTIGDVDMVFITAGMGGGTGTGAAPVIARACMDSDMLTVGVVTKPFRFEGPHRMNLANEGIRCLRESVDTMIIIPNQNLFLSATKDTAYMDAFRMADDVLLAGVKNVTDLMVKPGLINLDFADVQSVMVNGGNAMMGSGEAEGDNRAIAAAELALSNPLLGDISIKGAKGMIVNITGGPDMTLFEVDRAADRITREVEDPMANIIFGSSYELGMNGKFRVSIVATGIEEDSTA